MRYNIAALTGTDLVIAQQHSLGFDKKLWVSRDYAVELGVIDVVADGSGVWTADSVNTPSAAGADLQIVVDGELKADSAASVEFNVTFDNDAPGTAKATFSPPGFSKNQTFNFQHGIARDLEPQGGGNSTRKIKAILSIASVTNAKRFSGFKVYQLPDSNSYQDLGFIRTFEARIGNFPGVPIPDGRDGTAEVVRGRSEPSSLTIAGVHPSFVDGLNRIAGMEATIRCETWKGRRVLVERQVCTGCILQVNPNAPDGNAEFEDRAEGFMRKWLGFWAG